MDDSQSQSQTSPHEDRTAISDFRFGISALDENCSIYSSGHARDSTPDAGAGSTSSARYKLMSPAKLPISRSTCITIPPGLSPSSFLESPVLLSNNKPEPSPTTGSLLNSHLMQFSGGAPSFPSAGGFPKSKSDDGGNSDCFEFKFHPGPGFSGEKAVLSMMSTGMNIQRTEAYEQSQAHSQSQSLSSFPPVKMEASSSKEHNLPASFHMFAPRANLPGAAATHENQGMSLNPVSEMSSDYKDVTPSVTAERSSDDGYNWRKYGQKLVKGCEFPRSYYKCTQPNCEVKKIFERSYDGQIKESVYKGTHDHPKPQPSRRFTAGSMMPIQEKADKGSFSYAQDDKSTTHGQISNNMETNGARDPSPLRQNDDSNNEVNEDDPFSKRRRLDDVNTDVIMPVIKPIREPRVVVQTLSEVDILDDGYRWRKYGQKVVRGNPNPRSYYKCTHAGCPVRKHVERAAHDPKAVITTYEGKHNHDVPTAKNSSHQETARAAAAAAYINEMSIVRTEETDPISLDLGVGINGGSENDANNRQPYSSSQVDDQASTYYGGVNGGSFGSRESHVQSHRVATSSPNHSSNPYPMNTERILLGSSNCYLN